MNHYCRDTCIYSTVFFQSINIANKTMIILYTVRSARKPSSAVHTQFTTANSKDEVECLIIYIQYVSARKPSSAVHTQFTTAYSKDE